MSNPRDTAEAILLVIRRLAKWVLMLTLGVLSLGGLVFGGFEAYEYVTYERPKSQVTIRVKVSDPKCDPENPILIAALNDSKRTVEWVSVRLGAYVPNHSTNYAADYNVQYDRVLPPDEGWGACWRLRLTKGAPKGDDPTKYEWKVVSKSVRFSSD